MPDTITRAPALSVLPDDPKTVILRPARGAGFIVRTAFEADDGQPFDPTGWTWRIDFKRHATAATPVFTLAEGAGITKSAEGLVIAGTAEQVALVPPQRDPTHRVPRSEEPPRSSLVGQLIGTRAGDIWPALTLVLEPVTLTTQKFNEGQVEDLGQARAAVDDPEAPIVVSVEVSPVVAEVQDARDAAVAAAAQAQGYVQQAEDAADRAEGAADQVDDRLIGVDGLTRGLATAGRTRIAVVEDSPSPELGLSDDMVVAVSGNRLAWGNRVDPASTKTANIIEIVPATELPPGHILVVIEDRNDGNARLAEVPLSTAHWNAHLGEPVLLGLDTPVTLEAGGSYNMGMILFPDDPGAINGLQYTRVPSPPEAGDGVVNRINKSDPFSSSWGNTTGDFAVYIELYDSSDYRILDKIYTEAALVAGLDQHPVIVSIEDEAAETSGRVGRLERGTREAGLTRVTTVNDSPSPLVGLSGTRVIAGGLNAPAWGNRFTPASNITFNVIEIAPANPAPAGRILVVVEHDGERLVEIPLSTALWNQHLGETVMLGVGEDVVLEAGKTYDIGQIFWADDGNHTAYDLSYARVEVPDPDVIRRIRKSTNPDAAGWTTVGGVTPLAVYIELYHSTDYHSVDRIFPDAAHIGGLEDVVRGVIEEEVSGYEAFLPDEICVAVGQTVEVYNRQVVVSGNPAAWHCDWRCAIGQRKKRKFTVTPTAGQVGTHTLTLHIKNANNVVVETLTTTLRVVATPAPPSNPYRLLPIGASYTNNKVWYDEWKVLAESYLGSRDHIEFVGTIPGTWGHHEGRSGWTAGRYLRPADPATSDILLTVSGVSVPPVPKKLYNVPLAAGGTAPFEVEEVTLVGGSGTILLARLGDGAVAASGTITEEDPGQAGDASIAYSARSYVSENPFINPATNEFDPAYYLSEHGIATPDGVQFLLGTNSLSGGKASIEQGAQDLKTMIDAMRSAWGPGVQIFVGLIPFLSDQNGLGKSYGTNGSFEKLEVDHRVLYSAQYTYELLKDYPNLWFVPLAQCHDSEYNFGRVEVPVNPRSTAHVEWEPVEGVHPTNDGYRQFADIMYSTWLARQA